MAKQKTAEGAVTPPTKQTADWEKVETQYRIGTLSLREIATAHGITEGAVRKRAKRDKWDRDLGAKVRAKADALVRKELVRKEVREKGESASVQLDVDVEAEVQARIELSQRADIGKGRGIVVSLLSELEQACGPENAANLAELGELLRHPDDNGVDKLNDLYQKLVSLPGRAKTMKDLGESLRVLVEMERKAFGLDSEDKPTLIALLTDEQRAILESAVSGSY